MTSAAKRFVLEQLSRADIAIGADVTVKDERLYERVLRGGTLGLGESYMDGWWEAEPLDAFLFKLARARVQDAFPRDLPQLWSLLRARQINLWQIVLSPEGVPGGYRRVS